MLFTPVNRYTAWLIPTLVILWFGKHVISLKAVSWAKFEKCMLSIRKAGCLAKKKRTISKRSGVPIQQFLAQRAQWATSALMPLDLLSLY